MDVWTHVALAAIIMFAEEHQQNKQERTKADKKPTGDTEVMLTLGKNPRHCN